MAEQQCPAQLTPEAARDLARIARDDWALLASPGALPAAEGTALAGRLAAAVDARGLLALLGPPGAPEAPADPVAAALALVECRARWAPALAARAEAGELEEAAGGRKRRARAPSPTDAAPRADEDPRTRRPSKRPRKEVKPSAPALPEEQRQRSWSWLSSLWPWGRKEAAVSQQPLLDGIKRIYREHIRPLESRYRLDEFGVPLLSDSDFEAKPMVLFLGQYSTGKTSFISFLLGRDYPSAHIGPEPTTDRFIVVTGGRDDANIPGNALVVQNGPFKTLGKFGNEFLNKFHAAVTCGAPVLDDLNIIDTPGVLSGEKQRLDRSYDFEGVVEWFAHRADMIVLLFDANKLDISDEFKRTIEKLRGQDDKIRVVLNKADGVTSQQLIRVYGALMWSLGKVFKTPEVLRVFVGSFWNKPYQTPINEDLFDAERMDLLRDLHAVPRQSVVRKVNELVKRARMAKVYAYLLSHLRAQMPRYAFWSTASHQEALIRDLDKTIFGLLTKYSLSAGDFPDAAKATGSFVRCAPVADWLAVSPWGSTNQFGAILRTKDFYTFPQLDEAAVEAVDTALAKEIPALISAHGPLESQVSPSQSNPYESANNYERCVELLGIADDEVRRHRQTFAGLSLVGGRAPGQEVKKATAAYELEKEQLSRIWQLCDPGKHGLLHEQAFVVAMALVERASQGMQLPPDLPPL
eukprot:m51a1_g8597 putative eh domain-containing protein 1 (694) ;mRNA; f:141732-144484